ncbi:unnamed protein product [Larinioides sclopetarius]|uniref:Uncharacterized protein n=1 Tax=Larinioides sclopetarius TaxID=280406 RepID=A0AAV1ZBV0_9ARAC
MAYQDIISFHVKEKLLQSVEHLRLATRSSNSKKWNEYDCSIKNRMTRRCQTINVEIVFDDFEIQNITYNPKFESLEVLSAIGGYMGIYLGASIATFYDLVEVAITAIIRYTRKQRKASKKRKHQKKKAWLYDDFQKKSSARKYLKRRNKYTSRIRNIY